ncbi:MAG: pantoate--beta-alanine ligase [Pseudomonadota bacterium]
MQVIQSLEVMREQIAEWRADGDQIVLVPTMGNLHSGHLSLVLTAKNLGQRVVVSIYVNPTQFGEGEDFGSYPRTLKEDCERLMDAGADLVFTPEESTMYPLGVARATAMHIPEISAQLDGEHRPGHFDGVATVVCRLFAMVAPDKAVFGQKDYQQLQVIRQMVADLSLPVEVHQGATVREEDGLAMSSRNQYLDASERRQAPMIYAELSAIRRALSEGRRDYRSLEAESLARLEAAGFLPDYVSIRLPDTLEKARDPKCRHWVVLAAAQLGKARLIDNIVVDLTV